MGAHKSIHGSVLRIGFTHSLYIIVGVTSALAGHVRNIVSLTTIGEYDDYAGTCELSILVD